MRCHRRVSLLALVACVPFAQAQLIVNNDLGTLIAGSYNLTGTTAGFGDEATYCDPLTNPAGIWNEDYVYQFSTSDSLVYQVSTNAVTGDPDFFLLDSLATAFDGAKNFATGTLQSDFLDGSPPDFGTPALLPAGTYYLSIDSFGGFDGAPTPQDSTWDATLSLTAVVTPVAMPLGNLADAGDPFTIDTIGSQPTDTELGLFDSDGFIPDACDGGFECIDDDGGDDLTSLLSIDGLNTGTYYLALGTFNTTYSDGFGATSTGLGGDYILNYPGAMMTGVLGDDEVKWFSFTVGVPEPSSLFALLVGAMGLSFIRRR